MAYQIELSSSLSNLLNVFHVSQLHKYIHDPSHVVKLDDVQVKDNLTYETFPLSIDDNHTKWKQRLEFFPVQAATKEATKEQ